MHYLSIQKIQTNVYKAPESHGVCIIMHKSSNGLLFKIILTLKKWHTFKSDQTNLPCQPDWLQTVVLKRGRFAHFKQLLLHQNMNIISVSESSPLYFTGTRPRPCVCERLEDIDLCHALAIHPRLIHCQGSSSTVVFKTGRSIVRPDERWGQRPLNTPGWKVSTKSGRPFLNVPLRAPLSWYAHKDTLYSDATTP